MVSMVGYKRQVLQLRLFETTDKRVDVQLVPTVIETQAVEVIAKDPKEWRENLDGSKKNFLVPRATRHSVAS